MKLGKRHMRRGHLAKVIERKGALVSRLLAAPPWRAAWRPRSGFVAGLGAARRPALFSDLCARVPWSDQPRARADVDAVHGPAALVSSDDIDFGGSLDELSQVRASLERIAEASGAERPFVIALDYFIHAMQLQRAAESGADAVVLMACLVGDAELKALVGAARERGLEPIVECATTDELAVARALEIRVVATSVVDRDTLRPALPSAELQKGLASFERAIALSADAVPVGTRFDVVFLEQG